MARQLLLRGDKALAARWARWAEGKARALRRQHPQGRVHKHYRPTADVRIQINLFNGIEQVRVWAFLGEEASGSFFLFSDTAWFNAFHFSVDSGADELTVEGGEALDNNIEVRVKSEGGSLPAPLLPDTVYYLVNKSGDTFQIATTSGGSPIDLADAGSGDLLVGTDFDPIENFGLDSADNLYRLNEETGRWFTAGRADTGSAPRGYVVKDGILYYITSGTIYAWDNNSNTFVVADDSTFSEIQAIAEYNGEIYVAAQAAGDSRLKLHKSSDLVSWTNIGLPPTIEPLSGYEMTDIKSDASGVYFIIGQPLNQTDFTVWMGIYDGAWTLSLESGLIKDNDLDEIRFQLRQVGRAADGKYYATWRRRFNTAFGFVSEFGLMVWSGIEGDQIEMALHEDINGRPFDDREPDLKTANSKLYAYRDNVEVIMKAPGGAETVVPVGHIFEITGQFSIDDMNGGVNARVLDIDEYDTGIVVVGGSTGTNITEAGGNNHNAANLLFFNNGAWNNFKGVMGVSDRFILFIINSGVETLGSVLPQANIVSPSTGSEFELGSSIDFEGTATDPQDGDITASLSWTSNLDGNIGSGGSFSRDDLSDGTHTITAEITNPAGYTDSDSISITVGDQGGGGSGVL